MKPRPRPIHLLHAVPRSPPNRPAANSRPRLPLSSFLFLPPRRSKREQPHANRYIWRVTSICAARASEQQQTKLTNMAIAPRMVTLLDLSRPKKPFGVKADRITAGQKLCRAGVQRNITTQQYGRCHGIFGRGALVSLKHGVLCCYGRCCFMLLLN